MIFKSVLPVFGIFNERYVCWGLGYDLVNNGLSYDILSRLLNASTKFNNLKH